MADIFSDSGYSIYVLLFFSFNNNHVCVFFLLWLTSYYVIHCLLFAILWVGGVDVYNSPAAKGYDCAFCDKSTKIDTLVVIYIN